MTQTIQFWWSDYYASEKKITENIIQTIDALTTSIDFLLDILSNLNMAINKQK